MSDNTLLTCRAAAEVVGISERTMRRWLAAGRITGARKIAPNRYAIPSEALRALALSTRGHSHATDEREHVQADIHTLQAEVAALRRDLNALRAHVTLLDGLVHTPLAPVTRSEPNLGEQDTEGYNQSPTHLRGGLVATSVTVRQVVGEVRLSAWADRHGVPRRTAMDQAERGEIPAIRRADASRPRERPHWLTVEGQTEAVQVWAARGQGIRCEDALCVCQSVAWP